MRLPLLAVLLLIPAGFAWLDPALQYRAPIVINNGGSALADYQVAVNLSNLVYNNTGLVGSWHFNNNDAMDSSGYGNNGVQTGGMNCAVAGKFGGGCSFGGVSGYISAANTNFPSGATARTVSLWGKITGISGSDGGSYFCYGSGSTAQNFCLFEQISGANSYIRFVSRSDDYNPAIGPNLNDGNWHHIAMIYDGANISAYIDGVKIWDVAKSINTVLGTLAIGRSLWSTNYLNGAVDEVRIYNRALSASEIAALYSAGKLRPDYADLRFANSSDSSLPYWQENDNRAWVKVPYVQNGSSTIYAYYGNPNATGASNGSATFDFFDDFPGSSLDPAKWTSGVFSPQYGTGSVAVSNSVATVTGGTNTWWGMFANGAAFTTPPFTVEFLYRGDNGPHVGVETTGTLNPAPKDAAGFWYDGTGYGSCNNNVCNTEGTAPPIASYSLLRMDVYGGGIKYFVNRSLAYTKTTNVPDEGMKVYMAAAQPGGKAYTDWAFIRKYAPAEPAVLLQPEQAPSPAALLGVSPAGKEAPPSTNVTFTLYTYNNQTTADNFTLSCSGTCYYSENPVVTTSYQNKSVMVTITSGGSSGTTVYAITATSQANASRLSYVSASITVDPSLAWWDRNWTSRVLVYLNETQGLARYEPVQVSGAAINALAGVPVSVREIRVITAQEANLDNYSCANGQCEIRVQVEKANGTVVTGGTLADTDRVVFLGTVQANSSKRYFLYFNNPAASAPSYGDPGFTLTTSAFQTLKLGSPFDQACRSNGGVITDITYVPKATVVSGYAGQLGGGGCCAGVSNPRIITDGPVRKTIQFSNGAWIWNWAFYRNTEFFEYSNAGGVPSAYSFGMDRLSTIFNYYTYGSASPAWAGYGGGTFAVTEGWEAQYASGNGMVYGTVWNQSQANSASISYDPSDCCNCAPSDRGPSFSIGNFNSNATLRTYVHSSTDWNDVRNDWRAFMNPALVSVAELQQSSRAVVLSILPSSVATYPGYTEAFTLSVYNNQTIADNLTLSCTGTCSYTESPVILAANQTKTINVTITSANASGTTVYTITAASQANPANTGAAYATVTVDATRWRDQWHDAYNSEFKYRILVTLSNGGAALSDYQVGVTINTALPISLGKMRADCGDIRFTNGSNEMSYWIEGGCNSTNTSIWARVQYVPMGASAIYAYYGNQNATGKSSAVATFDFYEDFNAGSLNASVWGTGSGGGSYSYGIVSGMLSITGSTGANNAGSYEAVTVNPYPMIGREIRLRLVTATLNGGTYDEYAGMLAVSDTRALTGNFGNFIFGDSLQPVSNGLNLWVMQNRHGNNVYINADKKIAGAKTNIYNYLWYSLAATTDNVFAVRMPDSNNLTLLKDGVPVFNASGLGLNFNNSYIHLINADSSAASNTVRFDDVRVRKYAMPEPVTLVSMEQGKGYRTLVRRCGLKQQNANVSAYYPGNSSYASSCLSDQYGVCTLEISAGTYDLRFSFADNSTAWKNGTTFG